MVSKYVSQEAHVEAFPRSLASFRGLGEGGKSRSMPMPVAWWAPAATAVRAVAGFWWPVSWRRRDSAETRPPQGAKIKIDLAGRKQAVEILSVT